MRRIYALATAALFAFTACDNVTEPDPDSPRIDRLIPSGPVGFGDGARDR